MHWLCTNNFSCMCCHYYNFIVSIHKNTMSDQWLLTSMCSDVCQITLKNYNPLWNKLYEEVEYTWRQHSSHPYLPSRLFHFTGVLSEEQSVIKRHNHNRLQDTQDLCIISYHWDCLWLYHYAIIKPDPCRLQGLPSLAVPKGGLQL